MVSPATHLNCPRPSCDGVRRRRAGRSEVNGVGVALSCEATVRVSRTQRLHYPAVSLVTKTTAKRQALGKRLHLGKWTRRTRTIQIQAGTERTAQDVTTLIRTAHNAKLVNYFWNFPCNISRLWLTMGNSNHGKQNLVEVCVWQGAGGLLYKYIRVRSREKKSTSMI